MIYAFFLRIWKNDSLIWQQASLQIHAQCITFYFGQSSNSLENFEDQIWALWTRREKNSEHYKAWREQVRGKTWTWNIWKCTSVHKRYCFQQVHWNGDVRFKNRSFAPILSSNICQIWRKKHVATFTTVARRCFQKIFSKPLFDIFTSTTQQAPSPLLQVWPAGGLRLWKRKNSRKLRI